MLYKRILGLCTQHGISIAKLEKELGFGNATIRSWETSSPTVEKAKRVAEYFSLTIDELSADTPA